MNMLIRSRGIITHFVLHINKIRAFKQPLATALFNRNAHYASIVTPTHRHCSTSNVQQVDDGAFEAICEETLDGLTEYFEELVELDASIKDADISYSSGVLTLTLGTSCVYVINKQSPNKQIWLSSPTSGPKRFDYSVSDKCWIYRRTGQTLHQLLQEEMPKIFNVPNIDFSRCCFSKL